MFENVTVPFPNFSICARQPVMSTPLSWIHADTSRNNDSSFFRLQILGFLWWEHQKVYARIGRWWPNNASISCKMITMFIRNGEEQTFLTDLAVRTWLSLYSFVFLASETETRNHQLSKQYWYFTTLQQICLLCNIVRCKVGQYNRYTCIIVHWLKQSNHYRPIN